MLLDYDDDCNNNGYSTTMAATPSTITALEMLLDYDDDCNCTLQWCNVHHIRSVQPVVLMQLR
jgi:hypothetical protein